MYEKMNNRKLTHKCNYIELIQICHITDQQSVCIVHEQKINIIKIIINNVVLLFLEIYIFFMFTVKMAESEFFDEFLVNYFGKNEKKNIH